MAELMTFRRRLALLIDPTINAYASEPPLRLGYMYGVEGHLEHIATSLNHLEHIATSLNRLERKTVKRRPRIIQCEHQDTHPEWGAS